jgi:hypothetical protein
MSLLPVDITPRPEKNTLVPLFANGSDNAKIDSLLVEVEKLSSKVGVVVAEIEKVSVIMKAVGEADAPVTVAPVAPVVPDAPDAPVAPVVPVAFWMSQPIFRPSPERRTMPGATLPPTMSRSHWSCAWLGAIMRAPPLPHRW